MQYSPRGRFIEYVEGSPGDIVDRGEAIQALGEQMLNSADVLERIKSNAIDSGGQQGKAIEKLRESIGDSYLTLREAGELYEPVGPVIRSYGLALDQIQPLIRAAVDDSHDLWQTYVSLPGQVEPRGTGGFFQPDEGSPEAEQQAAEDAAKKAAYDAWEARTEDFDSHYDTWEEAFDTAVAGIEDELAGSIKDSFWDNFGDVITVLTEVLAWAALIVAVVAIFVGGGWIVLLAAGLSLLAFGLTCVKAANGAATGWDMLWAGLGIIPVCKLSNLTKLAQLPALSKAFGLGKGASKVWNAASKGPIDDIIRKGQKPFTSAAENVFGKPYKAVKMDNLMMFKGGGVPTAINNLSLIKGASALEWAAGRAGPLTGLYGKTQSALDSSGINLVKVPDPLGVLL